MPTPSTKHVSRYHQDGILSTKLFTLLTTSKMVVLGGLELDRMNIFTILTARVRGKDVKRVIMKIKLVGSRSLHYEMKAFSTLR